MGSCAAPSAKGDDKFITTDYLQQCPVHASELVGSLLKSSRPSGLAQAIMEVGRVNKTLYLLNYIDDEEYRRRILTQLNRGEGREHEKPRGSHRMMPSTGVKITTIIS
ncbi:Tn3 family transposase [Citrobacter freundii]|nr:Tn3 family transposase [Citrobacter freundii]MDT7232728.1 Tn3 family transposase [Citrobacter freundii]